MMSLRRLLLLTSLAANAAAHAQALPKCLDARDKPAAADWLNVELEAFGGPKHADPKLLVRTVDIQSEWNSHTRRLERTRSYIDGFVTVSEGRFRLVPGLGLTVKASDETVVYVCLRLDHKNVAGNVLRIIHLNKKGIFNQSFEPDPLPLSIRPINEAGLLMDEIFSPLRLDSRVVDTRNPVADGVETAINSVIGLLLRIGVQQVDIRPNEIELVTVSQLATVIDTTRIKRVFKYESKWMK